MESNLNSQVYFEKISIYYLQCFTSAPKKSLHSQGQSMPGWY